MLGYNVLRLCIVAVLVDQRDKLSKKEKRPLLLLIGLFDDAVG